MAKEEKTAKTAAKTDKKASAPAKEKTPAKEEKAKAPAPAKEEKTAARNYHVAKRPDGKWQVKFAGGEKAISCLRRRRRRSSTRKSSPKTRTGAFPYTKRTEKCANKSIEKKKKA